MTRPSRIIAAAAASPLKSSLLLVVSILAGVFTIRDVALNTERTSVGGHNIADSATLRFNRAFARVMTGDGDPKAIPALARGALREEPLDPEAISVLAVPGGEAGFRGGSYSYVLNLAERVSKRSLAVQLALIEEAVASDDIAGALVHYDRAMTVSQRSVDLFYPVLVSAIETEEIRTALVPYVTAGRWWTGPFLQYATANAQPRTVADFFRRFGGGKRIPAARPLEKALLLRLVERGDFEGASRYAATMKFGGARGLAQFGLNADSVDSMFGPLAWSAGTDGGIDVTLEGAQRADIVVPPGPGGVAIERIFPVSGGGWTLTQRLEMRDEQPQAITWHATCLGGSNRQRFWSETMTLKPGPNNHELALDVPADCGAARFSLSVGANEAGIETRLIIAALSLAKR